MFIWGLLKTKNVDNI